MNPGRHMHEATFSLRLHLAFGPQGEGLHGSTGAAGVVIATERERVITALLHALTV